MTIEEKPQQDATHVSSPDYSFDELLAAAQIMLAEQMFRFRPDAQQSFAAYLKRRMQQPRFSNACSVRDALVRASRHRTNRHFDKDGKSLKTDPRAIEPQDALTGRVLNDEMPGNS